jgi:cobalt-precorrin 5A hydrolase
MGLEQTMIVAGFGYRKGVSPEDIAMALEAALQGTRTSHDQVSLMAFPALKEDKAMIALASSRRVPWQPVLQCDLEAASEWTLTRSERAKGALNVHCVAEAAALAAAGRGARLLAPRVAVGSVTCALAARDPNT